VTRWLAVGAALPWLVAATQDAGRIDLYLFGEDQTTARLYERAGGERTYLGEGVVQAPGTAFRIVDATRWRCDRRTRRFEADAVRPDASTTTVRFSVRTPPCRDRLALRVRREGRVVAVNVRDRWKLGDGRVTLCTTRCRSVPFAGRERMTVHLPAGRRVRVRIGPERWTVSGNAPKLLVTGDSTVQNVDTALSEDLGGRARVLRDWRGGTSISYDKWRWPEVARQQAAHLRPRATVLSMGANEGWAMALPGGGTAGCCDDTWRAEYARRAGEMMDAYARGGRGSVLWMTLPAPRDDRRLEIARSVNAAVAAAASTRPSVTLVDVAGTISPGGAFRWRLKPGGPLVRERDGVHLTPAGGAIAARLVEDALPARFDP
jgi:lysophospholipase L1-like esterase